MPNALSDAHGACICRGTSNNSLITPKINIWEKNLDCDCKCTDGAPKWLYNIFESLTLIHMWTNYSPESINKISVP